MAETQGFEPEITIPGEVKTETVAEKTDAEKSAPEVTETAQKADATDQASAPKKVDPRQRKIAELSYQAREKDRQIERLLSLVEKTATRPAEVAKDQPPKLEDFRSVDEWADARDAWKESRRAESAPKANPQAEQYARHLESAREDLRSAGAEKYEDFDDVVFDDSVKITPPMRDAIYALDELETQSEVAYYLGKNPKEVLRIAKLSPVRQIAEIGKLEMKLTSEPAPKKKPSSAPEPISPVSGKETKSTKISESDSVAEHIKKRRDGLKFGQ